MPYSSSDYSQGHFERVSMRFSYVNTPFFISLVFARTVR